MISVTPSPDLEVEAVKPRGRNQKPKESTFTVKNTTDGAMAFKVQTTRGAKYR